MAFQSREKACAKTSMVDSLQGRERYSDHFNPFSIEILFSSNFFLNDLYMDLSS